jgi:hypothetical protein
MAAEHVGVFTLDMVDLKGSMSARLEADKNSTYLEDLVAVVWD